MTDVRPDQPSTTFHSLRSQRGAGSTWVFVTLGFTALFLIGVLAVSAVAIAKDDDSVVATVASSTLSVDLTEFAIDGVQDVPPGPVTMVVTNSGSAEHNLIVSGANAATPDLQSGESMSLDLGNLAAGEYALYCDITGHRESGMETTLVVSESAAAPTAPQAQGDGGDHGDDMDFAAMDQAMMESILAFPAETEQHGNPVLEPSEVRADGTKVFDLTAEIVDWEVEPGKFVEAWTYNGVVPAPQIFLDEGDRVEVNVTNNLPMGTDVHWHGVRTPNDQDGVAPITQDLIPPDGGTWTYEFTADEPAIGMYHAHNHAQVQVVRGMFGVIRIGENPVPRGATISGVTLPDDLELAVDMPMILNDSGTIGYSINGKSFPATEPIVVDQGDWVSITYYNEGLQIHPMHLHQFPQLVYAKDGVPLDEPYWVDTLNVAPGERYTVLFRADDAGVWVFHCHILTHVEREEGMFGMVTAIVVNEVDGYDPEAQPVRPTDFLLTAEPDHDH